MKLYEPPPRAPGLTPAEQAVADAVAAQLARRRKKLPRCRCGCGRAARWPQDGRPVFHTRLCGYLMALKMFRRKAR